MSPRPYRMERRREASDENRLRIIIAARELLSSPETSAKFSVEEVARRAGVARMTVYYQFGSLGGLLQALCDSLAIAGGINQLADAFRSPDPIEALDKFVAVFAGFWESDRAVLRALGALAVLDPEFAAVLEERSGWRRKGVGVLLDRLAKQTGHPKSKHMNDAADQLYMLTSFSTYDTLAVKRTRDQVAALIQQLARQVVR
ncbi:MAG TPA: TetR/AcrR family transcriptional regulator [Gemmatimonadales bacterium]|nr:TetR/AcrR family transcriptional regulator [Gemmatimonadales bacterium]